MPRAIIAFFLLFTLPAFAADPYDSSPGRIDLLYGGRGVGMAMLPGPDSDIDQRVVDAFASGLHADENGALLGGEVCWQHFDDVICNPLIARFDRDGRVVEEFGNGGYLEIFGHALPGDSPHFHFAANTGDGGWVSFATAPAIKLHLVRFDNEGNILRDREIPFGHAFINLGLHEHGERRLAVLHHPFALDQAPFDPPAIRVLALDTNGEPDADYGDNGTALVELPGYLFARGTALLEDGSLLVLFTDQDRTLLLKIANDGSGVVNDFGDNGVLDLGDLFGNGGIEAVDGSWVDATGLGVHDGKIIIAGSACCNAEDNFHVFALALDEHGELVDGYGTNGKGAWLSDESGSFVVADAMAVDRDNGRTAVLYFHDTTGERLVTLTPAGAIETGPVDDIQYLDEAPFLSFDLAFDNLGGLLAVTSAWHAPTFPGVNSLFGITRLLAPGETRVYDTTPDAFDGETIDGVAALSTVEFTPVSITGSNVALLFEMNGAGGWASVPGTPFVRAGVLPLGVPISVAHVTADSENQYTQNELVVGGIAATFTTYTGELPDPAPPPPTEPDEPNEPADPTPPSDPGEPNDPDEPKDPVVNPPVGDEPDGGGGPLSPAVVCLLALLRFLCRARLRPGHLRFAKPAFALSAHFMESGFP